MKLTTREMTFKSSMILLVALLCGSAIAQKPPASAKDDKASGWLQFSSEEGQFTVLMPGTPSADIVTVGTPFGMLKSHFFVLGTGTILYYISYVDLPESPQTQEETKAALDKSRDRALAKSSLISENDITLDGIPGRELLLDRDGMIQRGRIFYAKQRLYHVIITAPANVVFRDGKPSPHANDRTDLFEKSSAKFLDSFKLTK